MIRKGFALLQACVAPWKKRQFQRLIRYSLLMLCTIVLCGLVAHRSIAISATGSPASAALSQAPSQAPQTLVEQGRSLYEAGRFNEAASVLQQAVVAYRSQGDTPGEAAALSNLSLVNQQLGNWAEATEAIEQGLALLSANGASMTLAQALDVQGKLQLAQGDAEAALATWKRTEALYDRLNDQPGRMRSAINQAQALQALGLYRRALTTLEQLALSVASEAPSPAQVVLLRSLGEALRVAGNLEQAGAVLQQSLAIATQLQLPQEMAATQLSLGNTAAAQGDRPQARDWYQQVVAGAASPITQVQAQLNQLRLLLEAQPDRDVNPLEINALVEAITSQLDRLPVSRPAIYARINFADSLAKGQQAKPAAQADAKPIAQQLAIAVAQAQALHDQRAESFAQGNLGKLYEQQRQWAEAKQVTSAALQLASQSQASDLAYQWQWQLGRIFKQQQQRQQAIALYSEAVDTLQSLRADLTAINPEVQFSFRDSVEPVYRQFVGLLLQPGATSSKSELELARKTIESLQLAELDNFFRTACLNAEPRQIDQVDRQAAVFYPILLEDRIEVVLSLPGGELRHYRSTEATKARVEASAAQLLPFLKQVTSNNRVLPIAQQFYDWLIRPAEADLQTSNIQTLVFVLDGVLRNIPMAVLHDGHEYLIEKPYSLALTPGLQLLPSQPLQPQQLNVLLGGLSEARPPDFPPLSNVITEFAGIESQVTRSQELLNDRFTNDQIQKAISEIPFPVVHLATHGVFDSRRENTFILTWNDRITIDQLSDLLQSTELGRRRPIELLVLSACETAEGDSRAALGLAGIAVRAGARSTVATLWQVNDEAMSVLMKQFYQELGRADLTKAEALRRAQLSLLHDANNPEYHKPYYWSPIVLVGNWQ